MITTAAYPTAWALCGVFPLAAVPLVPVRLLPPGLRPERGGNPFADIAGGKPFAATRGQMGLDGPVHPGSRVVFAKVGQQ